jgi:hypothetical protein
MEPKVKSISVQNRRTVTGSRTLREALDAMIGKDEDIKLVNIYVVTLYEETLTDGSKVRSLTIRIKHI